MKKNLDLRVIKTQKTIKNVFLELIEEVGFPKISVQNIVDRAEINRSTFYLHYVDKYDLLGKVEDELMGNITNIALEMPAEIITINGFEGERVISIVLRVMEYIYENGKVFTLLMSDKGDPAFINKFGDVLKTVWIEKKILDRLFIPQKYASAAIVGMLSSLISEWLKSGLKETPEEFVQIITTIAKDVPKNLFVRNA